jgi:hypothetical protein
MRAALVAIGLVALSFSTSDSRADENSRGLTLGEFRAPSIAPPVDYGGPNFGANLGSPRSPNLGPLNLGPRRPKSFEELLKEYDHMSKERKEELAATSGMAYWAFRKGNSADRGDLRKWMIAHGVRNRSYQNFLIRGILMAARSRGFGWTTAGIAVVTGGLSLRSYLFVEPLLDGADVARQPLPDASEGIAASGILGRSAVNGTSGIIEASRIIGASGAFVAWDAIDASNAEIRREIAWSSPAEPGSLCQAL